MYDQVSKLDVLFLGDNIAEVLPQQGDGFVLFLMVLVIFA